MIVLGKGTAKPTERSFKGKGVGDFRGIVRFLKVTVSAVVPYTHENINSLSVRKMISVVLAIYFTVQFNDKSDYIN